MSRTALSIAFAVAISVLMSVECAAPSQSSGDRFTNLLLRSRPTPEHHALDDLVGDFDCETHFNLPNEPESSWKGATTNAWVLGGRFLECKASNSRDETSIESLRLLGYEPDSHEFTAVSLESLSLSHVDARGRFDAAKRTIVLKSEAVDRETQSREKTTEVLRIVDRDHYTREIWGQGAVGEPIQLVRASYQRANPSVRSQTPTRSIR